MVKLIIMRLIYFLVTLFILSEYSISRAEVSMNSSVDIAGVHRNYAHGSSHYDLFLDPSISTKYNSANWTVEGKLQLRHLQSRSNRDKNDWSYVSLVPAERLLSLGLDLSNEGSDQQTYLDIASLWIGYDIGDVQISLGRKALGIGVLMAFPVWNRLYPVVPSASGYLFHNNPDLVDVRWQKNSIGLAAYHIFSKDNERQLSSFEFTHYGENLESHILLGKWWDQTISGYTGVLDTSLGIFRLESLFILENDDLEGGTQFGVGYERAFTEDLSFLVEYYYSSFGADKSENYLTNNQNPFRVLLAKQYVFPQVTYKPTDLSSVRLGSLVNLIDESTLIQLKLDYSLADNKTIDLTIQKPLGAKGDEFGYLPYLAGVNLEYAQFISANFRMTF